MGSTINALKNSLGFGKQIDDLKENDTPQVDSIAELHNLILSGESRITQLEQVTNVDNITEFSGNTNTRLNNLETYSGTSNTKISNLETYSGSSNTRISNLETYSGSSNTRISNLETNTGTTNTRISNLESNTGTTNTRISNLETYSGTSNTKINNLETYSGTSNTRITTLENKKVAFSPMNISSCDLAPTAASTQYYYLTVAEMDMTISKAKLWGYSGSDLVMVGIYRGTLSSHTLIGEGSLTCGIGPNIINLTAKSGQTLNVTSGENLVVGIYPDGTSWRTIYDTGVSDITFGITNTSNLTSMPTTITGTATAIRFALTLY